MQALTFFALAIVILCFTLIAVFYFLQTRLIFYPKKLDKQYKFRLGDFDEEIYLRTKDDERIHALFFKGTRPDVILYFHGNAGDLSGWQFVAEDFTLYGYNVLMVDYRGYGKSSGSISEKGFYKDAEAAYYYLLREKDFTRKNIIVYGRSIGTGVAVELAAKHPVKGLVLEAPYSSLSKLANEKIPFFFPSLYLRYKFNNFAKIKTVKCPVIFMHGGKDELIPVTHTEKLYESFSGKKMKIIMPHGSHNDLNSFPQYRNFLRQDLPQFF